MRSLVAVAAFSLALANANASFLTYTFEGVLDHRLNEATFLGGETIIEREWRLEDVIVSDFVPGSSIGFGEFFNGSFTYDVTALSSSTHPNIATYSGAVQDLSVAFDALRFPSSLFPQMVSSGSLQVVNDLNANQRDQLNVWQWFSSPDWFASITLHFYDSHGDVFDDLSIPTNLSFSDFSSSLISIGIVDRQTQDQLQLLGTVTALRSIPIPEPNAIALLLLGLGGIGLIRFRR